MSSRFRPAVRLASHVEFRAVQQRGRRVAARYVTLLGRANDRGCDRLGIIASRKVGTAVVRNRAKRRLREIFRREEPDRAVDAGRRPFDVVVIVRRELADAPYAAVRADVQGALRKLRGEK
jgi:ribonuclease P protein component